MHPDVLAQLERSGFERDVARWMLRTDTGRQAYVILHDDGCTYSIHLEEFRGGEGYEDEVLRSTSAAEVVAAIAKWTAWANEPFTPPTTWWGRLRAYFGG